MIEEFEKALHNVGFTRVQIKLSTFLNIPWLYVECGTIEGLIRFDISCTTLEHYGVEQIAKSVFKEWHRNILKKIFK